jgi:hypothetical protein
MLKVEVLVVKEETLELEAATGVKSLLMILKRLSFLALIQCVEIARLALHKLVTDGRIHHTRIERSLPKKTN